MDLPPIILASASPRRAELLRELKREFEIIPSATPEIHDEQLSAGELSQINAYRKARSIAKRHPDALVLGMDTIVALGTRLFGKPSNMEEAHRMLQELQGKTHQVVTGVCLIHLRRHRQKTFAEWTDVTFRPLPDEALRAYHSKVNPLDKAGAYAIQEETAFLATDIIGSYSNVIGLPLERLEVELKAFLS